MSTSAHRVIVLLEKLRRFNCPFKKEKRKKKLEAATHPRFPTSLHCTECRLSTYAHLVEQLALPGGVSTSS